jgi:hypothetical protein
MPCREHPRGRVRRDRHARRRRFARGSGIEGHRGRPRAPADGELPAAADLASRQHRSVHRGNRSGDDRARGAAARHVLDIAGSDREAGVLARRQHRPPAGRDLPGERDLHPRRRRDRHRRRAGDEQRHADERERRCGVSPLAQGQNKPSVRHVLADGRVRVLLDQLLECGAVADRDERERVRLDPCDPGTAAAGGATSGSGRDQLDPADRRLPAALEQAARRRRRLQRRAGDPLWRVHARVHSADDPRRRVEARVPGHVRRLRERVLPQQRAAADRGLARLHGDLRSVRPLALRCQQHPAARGPVELPLQLLDCGRRRHDA